MRTYFVAGTLAATSALGIVAAVNYLIDVNGIYRTGSLQKYTAEYVRQMRGSRFGVRHVPFDRAVKIELARQSSAACYVTGSSKEMSISLDRMPPLKERCPSLVNLAESGGSYEDAVTLLAIATQRKASSVLIGIGPWFFLLNADKRWTEFANDYQSARIFFDLKPVGNSIYEEKLLNLINGAYFVRNLETILRRKGNKLPPVVEAQADGKNLANDDPIFRPDGSITYSRVFLEQAKPQDNVECRDYRVKPPFVNQEVVAEFRQVVQKIQQQNIQVTFVLMPFHPGVFRCHGLTVPAVEKTEQTVTELAAKLNAPIIGSYNPTRFELLPADFYDFMHVAAGSLHKIVR